MRSEFDEVAIRLMMFLVATAWATPRASMPRTSDPYQMTSRALPTRLTGPPPIVLIVVLK